MEQKKLMEIHIGVNCVNGSGAIVLDQDGMEMVFRARLVGRNKKS